MTTVDTVLEEGSGWVEVTLTESRMILSIKSDKGIRVRFGADSISSGFVVEGGSTLIVEETVWVKDQYDGIASVVAVTQ